MSERNEQGRAGQVPLGRAPGETEPEDEPNFAAEHDKTAVAEDIITDTDTEREPESPRGWSGMQR